MPAMYIIIPVLGVLALAYRFYSAFISAKIMMLDDSRVTPACSKNDGQNFHPTSKWVLFGHHFAAITGSGPLIGPVLAAQFGFAPGLIWIVAGVCLAGAVHDMLILWASTRRGGASLASIARTEIGPVAGTTAAIAILFVVVVALAGLGLTVVNALYGSAWAVFTIGMTIPIAIFMGFYTHTWRPGKTSEATVIGVIALILAVLLGKPFAASSYAHYLLFTQHQLVIILAVYGFFASVLPVWMLLAPRDYLSSFMKIGTIAFLVIGVIIVNPHLQMPAFTSYVNGGGPIIPGTLFPFAFITIACGAISGFHGLIGSGTTPKMISKESHIRPIGYGAMLMEGLVGVMALIAACSLQPADYFAINTPPAVYQKLTDESGTKMAVVNLPELEREVGETVQGRPGGGVSLAVGMAQIFSKLPGMAGWMDYWYHFAIMFEALFILTTIDAGTRVARFLVGEFISRGSPSLARMADHSWMPGAVISTSLVVFAWAYFIWVGSISTIWPMFGIANQLLATIALSIATTIILNNPKSARFAWVTLVPFAFLATTTLTAGWLSVQNNFWPLAIGADAGKHLQGYVDMIATLTMMACVLIIIGAAVRKWIQGRRFREGLTGQSIPPGDLEGKMSTPIGIPLAGLSGGAFVGFLLRPAIPLLGQLPLDVVLTRGANLQGLDVLARSTAESSFNYVLIGAVIGLAAGIGLSRMRTHVPQRGTHSVAVAPAVGIGPAMREPGAKFCAQCGTSLTSSAKFCASCGSEIRA